MTKNTEIVKKLYEASVDRDFDTVKSLVQPDYKLQDPMMNLNSAEELIDMMKSCPSGEVENLALVTEGDKVVATFDATMTEPVSARIRM